jgi:hypothetical protein
MKNYMIIFYTLLSVYILTSCKKEEDTYYSALGTIGITQDSTILEVDSGERLLVENPDNIAITINDQDRVIAYFTITEKAVPTGIDRIINIYNIDKVLFKPVFELIPEKTDSIGNDPLSIASLWLVKDYLNLSFMYSGGNQTLHYINLIRYPGEIPTDTINLEIRHNNNNDYGSYNYSAFVSFDLKSLRNNVTDSVILHIKAKEYDNRIYEKSFTYKY